MEFVSAVDMGDNNWDIFVDMAEGAWFWHSSAWRDYTVAYQPHLGSQSVAFMVRDAGRDVAAVPAMLERHADGRVRLSFGGDPCWSPCVLPGLDPRHRDAVLRACFSRTAEMGRASGAVSVSWRVSPIARGVQGFLPAFLAATTRAGCLDESLSSQVIDLRLSPERLLTAMRKGHRSDVKRGLQQFSVDILDSSTCSDADFDAYRAMHARAAGRATRPPRTFELMRSWIGSGRAFIVRCQEASRAKGFAYVLVHGDGAYYASAAAEPGERRPVGHVIQHTIISTLQRRGTCRYELGLQHHGIQWHDPPDAKSRAISAFKRGFGGSPFPAAIRTAWLDASVRRAELEQRLIGWLAADEAR